MKLPTRPTRIRFFGNLLCLATSFAIAMSTTLSACAQGDVQRTVVALAATSSGSGLIAAVGDTGAEAASHLFMFSPSTGQIAWQIGKLPAIASLAIAPDGATLAVGFVGISDSDAGVVLLDTKSGKQTGSLGFDEKLIFAPGRTYPTWGTGVSQLAYSPDGTLLYGLSNDTLFAWDIAAKHYLWIKDVPAVIEAPPDIPHPLPYGHATTFALSPDGRQIAVARDALRIATAGRTQPVHFTKRDVSIGLDPPATPVFSADSRTLAAGELNTAHLRGSLTYATELWVSGALKAQKIDGCGGGMAWTYDPDVFACQNDTGAHLRNVHDPAKDIGVAGPASELPILKVGNSLWAAAYRTADWKDSAKPLPLTLVELGTGKRVTVTIPGRK